MEETPEQIIEEYLTLVREKLPESIADDVITELRTYMLETASEVANGDLTEDVAKRVVARFGAPGEVADEYRYSIFPESMDDEPEPPTKAEDRPAQPAKRVPTQEAVELMREQQTREHAPTDPVYSYTEAFKKVVGLTFFWAIMVAIFSTAFGGNWTSIVAAQILIIQTVIVASYSTLKLLQLEKAGARLWRKGDESWSNLQKLVTLPEGIFDEQSSLFVALDIIGSSLGLLIFSLLQIPTSLGIWYFLMISIPGTLAFGLKTWYAFKSYGKADPLSYARKQFGANFVALAVSGAAVSWISINPAWYRIFNFTGAELIITVYSALFGPLILYQIVIGAQDLWWQTQTVVEKEPKEESSETKRRALIELRRTISKIALYGIGAVAFMVAIPMLVDFLGLMAYTVFSYRLFPILLVTLPAIIPIIIVYYVYRRLFITRLASSMPVGRRTRPEALVDLLLSASFGAALLIILLTSFLSVDYFRYLLYDLMIQFDELGAALYLGSQIFSMVLLVGALWIRVATDFLRITNRRYQDSIRWLSNTNILLIVGISIVFFLEYVDMSSHFINMNFLLIVFYLGLVMALGIQTALSRKQLEITKTSKRPLKAQSKKISPEDWKKNM